MLHMPCVFKPRREFELREGCVAARAVCFQAEKRISGEGRPGRCEGSSGGSREDSHIPTGDRGAATPQCYCSGGGSGQLPGNPFSIPVCLPSRVGPVSPLPFRPAWFPFPRLPSVPCGGPACPFALPLPWVPYPRLPSVPGGGPAPLSWLPGFKGLRCRGQWMSRLREKNDSMN